MQKLWDELQEYMIKIDNLERECDLFQDFLIKYVNNFEESLKNIQLSEWFFVLSRIRNYKVPYSKFEQEFDELKEFIDTQANIDEIILLAINSTKDLYDYLRANEVDIIKKSPSIFLCVNKLSFSDNELLFKINSLLKKQDCNFKKLFLKLYFTTYNLSKNMQVTLYNLVDLNCCMKESDSFIVKEIVKIKVVNSIEENGIYDLIRNYYQQLYKKHKYELKTFQKNHSRLMVLYNILTKDQNSELIPLTKELSENLGNDEITEYVLLAILAKNDNYYQQIYQKYQQTGQKQISELKKLANLFQYDLLEFSEDFLKQLCLMNSLKHYEKIFSFLRNSCHYNQDWQFKNLLINTKIDNLDLLTKWLSKGFISEYFVVKNLNLLIDNELFSNFNENSNLLSKYKNFTLTDYSVLFLEPVVFKNRLESIIPYGLNCNLNFIKNDNYLYQLDALLELGMINQINDFDVLNNQDLPELLKMCQIVGFSPLTNQRINPNLNYLLGNPDLNENYVGWDFEEFDGDDKTGNDLTPDMVEIMFNDFLVNPILYQIDSLLISKPKVIRNLQNYFSKYHYLTDDLIIQAFLEGTKFTLDEIDLIRKTVASKLTLKHYQKQ